MNRAPHRPEPLRPTGDDREHVAAEIRAAVDEGRLDLPDAGRRLSAVYRAATPHELAALRRGLAGPAAARSRPGDTAGTDRDFYLWAVVRVVFLAAATVILLLAVLHGIDPVDPH